MKLSYLLGIAIVLLAVNMAMADNTLYLNADVSCPYTTSTTFPDITVPTQSVVIPNILHLYKPSLLTIGHCGPWSVSIASDKADGKMTTSSGYALGMPLQIQLLAAGSTNTGHVDGYKIPVSTEWRRLAYDYGNPPEVFDAQAVNPTFATDRAGIYSITLYAMFSETV